jgi:hypothetical protein
MIPRGFHLVTRPFDNDEKKGQEARAGSAPLAGFLHPWRAWITVEPVRTP